MYEPKLNNNIHICYTNPQTVLTEPLHSTLFRRRCMFTSQLEGAQRTSYPIPLQKEKEKKKEKKAVKTRMSRLYTV